LDVVVVHDQGASTARLGIYTLAGGKLRHRPVEGNRRLAEGGGGTHMEVTDCAGSGYVISSGAGSPDGTVWHVQRTVFRVTESGALRHVPAFARRARVKRFEHIAPQFPEFTAGSGPAFRSCAVARIPR
jgi:hypothetical protein